MSPIVKWAGGKEQELKYILPNMPSAFSRFIEPFVGGGAVYFSMDCKDLVINDKSLELTNLYNNVKYYNSDFVQKLQNIYDVWVSLEDVLGRGATGETSKGGSNNVDPNGFVVKIARNMGISFGD